MAGLKVQLHGGNKGFVPYLRCEMLVGMVGTTSLLIRAPNSPFKAHYEIIQYAMYYGKGRLFELLYTLIVYPCYTKVHC